MELHLLFCRDWCQWIKDYSSHCLVLRTNYRFWDWWNVYRDFWETQRRGAVTICWNWSKSEVMRTESDLSLYKRSYLSWYEVILRDLISFQAFCAQFRLISRWESHDRIATMIFKLFINSNKDGRTKMPWREDFVPTITTKRKLTHLASTYSCSTNLLIQSRLHRSLIVHVRGAIDPTEAM